MKRHCTRLIAVVVIHCFVWTCQAQLNGKLDVPQNPNYYDLDVSQCPSRLQVNLTKQIRGYYTIARSIMDEVTRGSFKGKFYKDLAKFADKFGSRISGSQNLENSIDYLKRKFKRANLQDVEEQPVKVPKWVR